MRPAVVVDQLTAVHAGVARTNRALERCVAQVPDASKRCHRHGPDGEQTVQRRPRVLRFQRLELAQSVRMTPPTSTTAIVDDRAAADRAVQALIADHQPVAVLDRERIGQLELHQRLLAGLDAAALQQGEPGGAVAGGVVDVHRRPVAQRAREVLEQPNSRDHGGVARLGRGRQPAAARQYGGVRAGEVDRRPIAGAGVGRRLVLHMQTTHPQGGTTGKGIDGLLQRDGPAEHGAGGYQSGALQKEGAVDGQSERPVVSVAVRLRRVSEQVVAERVDPCAVDGRGLEHARPGQEAACQQSIGFGPGLRHPIRRNAITFGEGHSALGHADEAQNLQVLPALRHRPVVDGNGQQGVLVRGHPRHHVVDETVMARHVDEPERTAALLQIGEAEIDGQTAPPLLRQAVGGDAGERLDQGGLAVVHMAGEGDDHEGACNAPRICSNSASGSAPRMSSQTASRCKRAITGTGSARRLSCSARVRAGSSCRMLTATLVST
jgi:hypothetical protein